MLAGVRVAAAVGSGFGDDLSGRIDAGRVDGLSTEVTISEGGSVSDGLGDPGGK